MYTHSLPAPKRAWSFPSGSIQTRSVRVSRWSYGGAFAPWTTMTGRTMPPQRTTTAAAMRDKFS